MPDSVLPPGALFAALKQWIVSKVEDRAAEIIAEEMSLRDFREPRKLTQSRVAKALGITQDSVSRLEKRSDLLISTQRKTVNAMGGGVRIVAEFPDRAPVVLSKYPRTKHRANPSENMRKFKPEILLLSVLREIGPSQRLTPGELPCYNRRF